MKQQQFEAAHAELWQQVDAILQGTAGARNSNLPQLYRRLCQSLALAMQRGYSPALCAHLQKMVHDCHQRMYGKTVSAPMTIGRILFHDFPRKVREEWVLLLVAMTAFWGVAAITGLMVWFQPHWAYSFLEPENLARAHAMYSPDSFNKGRMHAGGDVQMFGFYIWNNVSICFRTFAGGICGGLPALYSLGLNGMNLGVVGAWLSLDPATRNNFWSFVITHASFEITGLILASQAGLRLGLALLRPGRLSRRHALLQASTNMFPVIVGAASMTAFAAFFEGFWSASTLIPYQVKYAVGAFCWLLVILFFTLAGRGRA